MKKKVMMILFLIIILYTGCHSGNDEPENPFEKGQIALYDQEKQSVAYIDYDDEATIYLWGGTSVAYLIFSEDRTISENEVYGFNGKCLGWYSDGVMYDRNGYAVGARKGIARGAIFTTVVHADRPKGIKYVKPVKRVLEISPLQHVFIDRWSETLLTDFLKKGIEDN